MNNKNMIPKTIHYCWLGGGNFSPKLKKCMASWDKHLDDYEIVEWNENNFDVHMNKYISQAYTEKKYAFAADYIRLYVLYYHGGIYLDTDVEVIKSYNSLLGKSAFIGLENGRIVGPDTMGAAHGNTLIKEVMDSYSSREFIHDDGSYDYTPISDYMTQFFIKEGMTQTNKRQEAGGFSIFPSEFFHPLDFWTKTLVITENTYSIHRWTESWKSFPERMKTQLNRIVGDRIMIRLSKIKQWCLGIIGKK